MSEEPEVKPAEEVEAPAKKGGGKSKLIVMVLLALVLAGGGFFGFKIMGAKKSSGPKVLKVGKTVTLQEFLVNLNDQKTFLKTQISLGIADGMELGHASGGGGHGAKEEDDPVVRDTIIMILTSKKLSDISSPAGKEKLKQEIIKALNEHFGEHPKPKENPELADKSTDNPDQKKSGETKSEEPNQGPVLEVYFTSFATQRL